MDLKKESFAGNSCVENVDCLASKQGLSYVGYENKTISGRTCKSWQGQSLGGDLEGNFCRNPDEDTTVWCFTTDPEKVWEYCDVKECEVCSVGMQNFNIIFCSDHSM